MWRDRSERTPQVPVSVIAKRTIHLSWISGTVGVLHKLNGCNTEPDE